MAMPGSGNITATDVRYEVMLEHRVAFETPARQQLDSLIPEGTTVAYAKDLTADAQRKGWGGWVDLFWEKGVWERWADTKASTLGESDLENGMDLDYAAFAASLPEPTWENDRVRGTRYPVYPKPVPPVVAAQEQVRGLTSQEDVRRSLYDMAARLNRICDENHFFAARHRLQPSR